MWLMGAGSVSVEGEGESARHTNFEYRGEARLEEVSVSDQQSISGAPSSSNRPPPSISRKNVKVSLKVARK